MFCRIRVKCCFNAARKEPSQRFVSSFSVNAYFEHDLFEVLLVELPELAEAEFAEVGEEDPPLLLDLALHVHHLLLRGRQTQGLHGGQQVLSEETVTLGDNYQGNKWTAVKRHSIAETSVYLPTIKLNYHTILFL